MAGQRKTFNEINITPLTDIFLVLLIIMMVIAPLLDQQGLNLAVPNVIEVQDDEIKDLKLIKITVTDDDKYYAEDVEISASSTDISSMTDAYKNYYKSYISEGYFVYDINLTDGFKLKGTNRACCKTKCSD